MLTEIQEVFGLHTLSVAELIGVPTLYPLLTGRGTPKAAKGLTALYNLAVKVRKETGPPTRAALTSVQVDGKTLLGHLKASHRDPDRIVDVCRRIIRLRAELPPPPPWTPKDSAAFRRMLMGIGKSA